jgi:hypothetical protein
VNRRSLLLGPAALTAAPQAPAETPHARTAAETAASVWPRDHQYPPLDLRRYGADPTGVTPSDAAMANAIAVCGASGGTIRAPGGLYSFGGQIGLAGRRSIIITGDAAATGGALAATCFTYTGADDRVFINMNSAVGCHLRGLQITHRDPRYTGTYIKCSNVGGNDPSLCTVMDCVLGSNAGRGNLHLDLDKCIEFTAERCGFSYGNPSVRGQAARGRGYSNSIHFRDCQWSANHMPAVQDGGQAWTFTGCTFENLLSGAAGALYSSPGTAFNALAIIGCWFGDASAPGTWIDVYANGVLISGNYISGNTAGTTGIALRRSIGVKIAGNLFDQLRVGIDFPAGPCRDIVVQGNVASLVKTGFDSTDNVPTGSLVWGPNYGFGAPGSSHQRLASDGYVADAASGILRQWGAAAITAEAPTHTIRFPMKFPTQCFNVVATLSGGSSSGGARVSGVSAASFQATIQGGAGAATLYWQAVGN